MTYKHSVLLLSLFFILILIGQEDKKVDIGTVNSGVELLSIKKGCRIIQGRIYCIHDK